MSVAPTLESLPYFAEGEVVSGFKRGSKELGIPTANFPEDVIKKLPGSFECGVYYGWAKISSDSRVFKMTMCVGWNPYYHNTVKTMETHIIHNFENDFYGDVMKIVVLGFMRPMCDFSSLDALIKAIHNDIQVASTHLDSAENAHYKNHPFFLDSTTNTISNGPSNECNKPSLNGHDLAPSNHSDNNGKLYSSNCAGKTAPHTLVNGASHTPESLKSSKDTDDISLHNL